MPVGVLMLVALLAAGRHGEHIDIAQANGLRSLPDEMHADVAQLGGQARFVAIEAGSITVRRSVEDCVRRPPSRGNWHSPARAAMCSSTTLHTRMRSSSAPPNATARTSELEDAHHDRNAVPFQFRTSAAEA